MPAGALRYAAPAGPASGQARLVLAALPSLALADRQISGTRFLAPDGVLVFTGQLKLQKVRELNVLDELMADYLVQLFDQFRAKLGQAGLLQILPAGITHDGFHGGAESMLAIMHDIFHIKQLLGMPIGCQVGIVLQHGQVTGSRGTPGHGFEIPQRNFQVSRRALGRLFSLLPGTDLFAGALFLHKQYQQAAHANQRGNQYQ